MEENVARSGTHLFQSFREVIQRIENAVVIHRLVSVDYVVGSTRAEYAVNEVSLSRGGGLFERLQKIFYG